MEKKVGILRDELENVYDNALTLVHSDSKCEEDSNGGNEFNANGNSRLSGPGAATADWEHGEKTSTVEPSAAAEEAGGGKQGESEEAKRGKEEKNNQKKDNLLTNVKKSEKKKETTEASLSPATNPLESLDSVLPADPSLTTDYDFVELIKHSEIRMRKLEAENAWMRLQEGGILLSENAWMKFN
jgi:hypothetical protein